MSISNDIFDTFEPITMSAAQGQLKTGDIMLCSGNGTMSNIIKTGTNSVFSHVALLLPLPITGQWLVLESVESKGVRCVTLPHSYLHDYCGTGQAYDGKILVARHQDMADQQDNWSQLYRQAFALIGSEYSEQDILRIAKRLASQIIGIDIHGQIKPGERYICSEYVYTCLKAINICLPFDPLGFIAPADIANAEKIKAVCRLL